MREIKLRAKRKNTEDWLMFNPSDLFHSVGTGLYQVCVEDAGLFAIDPDTIRLADDPRKHPMFTVSCPNCDYEYMDPFEDGSFECPECELYLPPKKDPRKAMLDEIRKRVYKYSYADWHRMLMEILDEMEAKL